MSIKINRKQRIKNREQKKRKICFLTFVFCFLYSISYAAPCYGTRMPSKNKIVLGLQYHSIFRRYLEHQAGRLRSSQQFLLLSYGIFDWFSLDLKGGAGNIKQHPVNSDELDYSTYLGGGYGFRLKLYDCDKIKAVFGFQHISVHPKTISINGQKHKAVLDDWQFSTLVFYDFNKITPYLGTRWSRVDYIHWIDNARDRVKSDLTKSIGFIFGFDLPVTKNIWLNLEGSSFDSETFSLSVNYSF
ncbi:MAG: hypothetical protein NC916_01830 [Candidatus Omnitrophica bacterium]|nr:hypothetical protein [Candidatus Omnitrophota bacterium]